MFYLALGSMATNSELLPSGVGTSSLVQAPLSSLYQQLKLEAFQTLYSLENVNISAEIPIFPWLDLK